MSWIVVQTKSQCEDYAARNLNESGFKTFSPKITLQNGLKPQILPMFRGYIFVKIELGDVKRWRTVRSHRGVLKVLALPNGIPAILPRDLVDDMIAQGEVVEQIKPVACYTRGSKIMFTAGPLSGISGIIQSTNKERVELLVNLLGLNTVVQSTVQMIAPDMSATHFGGSAAAIQR